MISSKSTEQMHQSLRFIARRSNTAQRLDDWLTVHHSITLVDLQFDAQTSCLFTYNTLIKILYMFRAYLAHLQEVYVVMHAASGIVTLYR
jgi:hypothetical protein